MENVEESLGKLRGVDGRWKILAGDYGANGRDGEMIVENILGHVGEIVGAILGIFNIDRCRQGGVFNHLVVCSFSSSHRTYN